MSVPNFNPLDYPPTTKETATRRFHEDRATCGVWILDASGDILDANEQGCYIWGALKPDGTPDLDMLIGYSVFEVYVRPDVLPRIAMPTGKKDLLYTKIMVFKKMEKDLALHVVKTFKEAILAHPILKFYYLDADVMIDQEYSYKLRISPPGLSLRQAEQVPPLVFEVSVERILEEGDHKGYLVQFRPAWATIPHMKEAYERMTQGSGGLATSANTKPQHIFFITQALSWVGRNLVAYFDLNRRAAKAYATSNSSASQPAQTVLDYFNLNKRAEKAYGQVEEEAEDTVPVGGQRLPKN